MDLHDVAREVAKTAAADFAFVLSQAGLLVTRDAPREMPDSGRMKILWACPAGKNGEVTHLEMSREDLVPFGGAAPIDVFAVRVEDTAILVAVMSTWNDKANVVLALTTGAATLGEMIRKAKRARAQKGVARKGEAPRKEKGATAGARRERTSALPPEGTRRERVATLPPESGKRERTSALPPDGTRRARASVLPGAPPKERTSSLPRAPGAAKKSARPRGSEPEITLGEASVGRETLIAIELTRPRSPSEPDITVGEATVGRETLYAIEAAMPRAMPGPAPDGVRVQLDSMGRETLAEIEHIEAVQSSRRPTVEEPLVLSDRRTLPWVDSPAALKRSMEAKVAARGRAAPDVKVTVEEMDPEALEMALREDDRR